MLLLYVDDLFLTKKRNSLKFQEMKDLDMIHYFLDMEAWKNADGIFLGQRKYATEILNRFKMIDCKAMTTRMASIMKLLSDASSETVDATMYRQMFFSLMFLTYLRHAHLIA